MQSDLLLLTMLQHIIGYARNVSYFYNVQIEPKKCPSIEKAKCIMNPHIVAFLQQTSTV